MPSGHRPLLSDVGADRDPEDLDDEVDDTLPSDLWFGRADR